MFERMPGIVIVSVLAGAIGGLPPQSGSVRPVLPNSWTNPCLKSYVRNNLN